MLPESEENRLDQSLRDKFEDFDLAPTAPVWAGIEQRLAALPPPPVLRKRRPVPLPFLFGLTALLAGLGGWLLPHGTGRFAPAGPVAAVAPAPRSGSPKWGQVVEPDKNSTVLSPGLANPSTEMPNRNPGLANLGSGTPNLSTGMPNRNSGLPNLGSGTPKLSTGMPNLGLGLPNRSRKGRYLQLLLAKSKLNAAGRPAETPHPTAGAAVPEAGMAATAARPAESPAVAGASAAAEAAPATLRTLITLERETLVQLPSIFTLAPGTPPAGSRPALLLSLRAERAELLRLQRRADSLLLALGDLPGAPLLARADTSQQRETSSQAPKLSRWSLALSAAPEQNVLTLQGPEGDSLTALRRNHETGHPGLSAAVMAEYRLNPRLSVGTGLGFNTFGADLRITNKNTEVSVRYETTTTATTNVFTSTNHTYSIRTIQVPQQSPVFNAAGQVIGYVTVFVPRQDTLFTTIVQRDTVHSIRQTITPFISKRETVSTKLLQPNYRFVTLPVLLRYRLTMGPGRWWADASAGAQLQFFLGGTQVVTNDGEHFRTESVSAGGGPFRPLNLAFTGSMALNYALTNRLSVSVAPSVRWQALSLYKPETGLRQQSAATGLMFGVRFGL